MTSHCSAAVAAAPRSLSRQKRTLNHWTDTLQYTPRGRYSELMSVAVHALHFIPVMQNYHNVKFKEQYTFMVTVLYYLLCLILTPNISTSLTRKDAFIKFTDKN